MRIIDADEFKEQLKQRYMKAVEWKSKTVYYERADGAIATYLEAIRTLNSAPTVDAVPVVRCKDCKRYKHEEEDEVGMGWCANFKPASNEPLFAGMIGIVRMEKEKMTNKMEFPETWEEFEEEYGITDRFEMYSNGERLIPSFRVKQWLEHLEDERKKQERQEEGEGCPYYTTRIDTRYLSDAEMCKVYALTGKVMRSAEQRIGCCMGTRDFEECHCDGLKRKCEHK